MVPDSMRFEARNPEMFQNHRQDGFSEYLASHVQAGKSLRFRLSAGKHVWELDMGAEGTVQHFKSLQLAATAVPQMANPIATVLLASRFSWEKRFLFFTAMLAVFLCAGSTTLGFLKKRIFQGRACGREG